MANKKEEVLREAKSGNSGLDVYIESSEKERSGENVRKTVSLAAAGATFIPFGFGSTKVVVLGQENLFTCVCAVFNVVKHLFGGGF